jgi:hypothetical protein
MSSKKPVRYKSRMVLRASAGVSVVADLDRNETEDIAFGYALQSVDPNIGDAEGFGKNELEVRISRSSRQNFFMKNLVVPCSRRPAGISSRRSLGDQRNISLNMARLISPMTSIRPMYWPTIWVLSETGDPLIQLDEVVQQVTTVEHRDRQQVDDGQRQADQAEKKQEPGKAQSGRGVRHLGDGDRARTGCSRMPCR